MGLLHHDVIATSIDVVDSVGELTSEPAILPLAILTVPGRFQTVDVY